MQLANLGEPTYIQNYVLYKDASESGSHVFLQRCSSEDRPIQPIRRSRIVPGLPRRAPQYRSPPRQSATATSPGCWPVVPVPAGDPPRTNFGADILQKTPRKGPEHKIDKLQGFLSKNPADPPSLLLLSLSREHGVAGAADRRAALSAPPQPDPPPRSVPPPRFHPPAADRGLGRRIRGGFFAAVLAVCLRVRTTPSAPFRRPRHSGGATPG